MARRLHCLLLGRELRPTAQREHRNRSGRQLDGALDGDALLRVEVQCLVEHLQELLCPRAGLHLAIHSVQGIFGRFSCILGCRYCVSFVLTVFYCVLIRFSAFSDQFRFSGLKCSASWSSCRSSFVQALDFHLAEPHDEGPRLPANRTGSRINAYM